MAWVAYYRQNLLEVDPSLRMTKGSGGYMSLPSNIAKHKRWILGFSSLSYILLGRLVGDNFVVSLSLAGASLGLARLRELAF